MTKQKSKTAYYHDYPDGSTLRVSATRKGNYTTIQFSSVLDSLDEFERLEVNIRLDTPDAVIKSPIGGIVSLRPVAADNYNLTVKEYKEFIRLFWEEGFQFYKSPGYYDFLISKTTNT